MDNNNETRTQIISYDGNRENHFPLKSLYSRKFLYKKKKYIYIYTYIYIHIIYIHIYI
jgi:hypothetical protein